MRRNCSEETLTATVNSGQALPSSASTAQHPVAELDDQPAVLGDGDEFARRDLTAGRMCPAAERLDADDGLAALVDDGLVQEPQVVVFDRLAQVGLKKLAARKIGVHRGVVDTGAVAALVLGAVERHVGVAHDVSAPFHTCYRSPRCRSRPR